VTPEASPQLAGRLRIAESRARADRAAARGPVLALASIVVLAAIGYAALAQLVDMPLLNPDELRYTIAARGVAEGEWLNLRGDAYGYGAVYPLVLAPILALAGGVEAAYPLFKVANALLFALAAVPIYLLARRLLPPWWSVAVAAMSLAIPSSIYTSLVLTESAAYLTSSIALLAVVLALERPRQRRGRIRDPLVAGDRLPDHAADVAEGDHAPHAGRDRGRDQERAGDREPRPQLGRQAHDSP